MLEAQGLQKQFAGQTVLRGLNLRLQTGEVLYLVGGSGTGKSVTLKLLAGLLEPDAGEIFLNGQPVHGLDDAQWQPLRREYGFVFQQPALFDGLTVAENVGLRLLEEGEKPKTVWPKAEEALRRVGLGPEVLNKYPAELSGGMQKRVGIARAVLHAPKLLLYDEPTTGLDPANAGRVDQLIRELSPGTASLVVSHDLDSVRANATRVILLYQGTARYDGPTAGFFSAEDPVVQAFLAR